MPMLRTLSSKCISIFTSTLHTENLKEYCEFIDVEYRSHNKMQWLSFLPDIERPLQMSPALKVFFLSQAKKNSLIKNFFEEEFMKITSDRCTHSCACFNHAFRR